MKTIRSYRDTRNVPSLRVFAYGSIATTLTLGILTLSSVYREKGVVPDGVLTTVIIVSGVILLPAVLFLLLSKK